MRTFHVRSVSRDQAAGCFKSGDAFAHVDPRATLKFTIAIEAESAERTLLLAHVKIERKCCDVIMRGDIVEIHRKVKMLQAWRFTEAATMPKNDVELQLYLKVFCAND